LSVSILVLCLKKENVKSQKSQKVCLVLRQSVSEMFLWIDIFFPCQTTEIKNKKAKSVFLVLCLKIVLFVVLSFSEICPESSLCQFFFVFSCSQYVIHLQGQPYASSFPDTNIWYWLGKAFVDISSSFPFFWDNFYLQCLD